MFNQLLRVQLSCSSTQSFSIFKNILTSFFGISKLHLFLISGYRKLFDWNEYLDKIDMLAAPYDLFTPVRIFATTYWKCRWAGKLTSQFLSPCFLTSEWPLTLNLIGQHAHFLKSTCDMELINMARKK